MKLLITILISILLFSNTLFSLDEGTSGVEYSIGQTILNHSEIDGEETEVFVHLSHNYLSYYGFLFFSFKSQLGVSKHLLFQSSDTSVGSSYKNIITGIIPGIKYKYLNGYYGFIPEVSLGLTLDVISLWGEKDSASSLIFFSGINLGTGFAYEFSMGLRLGFKLMYDFGYGNYMNEKKARFNVSVLTLMLTFDFYDE